MKVLEFETSKGKFKLIDMPETIRINGWNGAIVIDDENQIPQDKYTKGFYLKNVTEKQASEVIDYYNFGTNENKDIGYLCYYSGKFILNSATKSLYSLLQLQPVQLFKNTAKLLMNKLESEAKTFYNPFIYKL